MPAWFDEFFLVSRVSIAGLRVESLLSKESYHENGVLRDAHLAAGARYVRQQDREDRRPRKLPATDVKRARVCVAAMLRVRVFPHGLRC